MESKCVMISVQRRLWYIYQESTKDSKFGYYLFIFSGFDFKLRLKFKSFYLKVYNIDEDCRPS